MNIAGDTDLLGKVVGDLQTGVSIRDGKVLGTLKYVDDYTGFSGDPALQKGHYLVMHAASETGATIKAGLSGGQDGEKTLDADGLVIFRVTSPSQNVTFTATKSGVTSKKTLRLASISLEEES